MFMITVSFGSSSCPLLFKTPEAAQAVWETISNPAINIGPDAVDSYQLGRTSPFWRPIIITDDFGRRIYLSNGCSGAVFEDMNVAQEGQIEIGLHQARTQVKANQRGRSDPVLSSAAQMQGPAIISPMSGNGRVF